MIHPLLNYKEQQELFVRMLHVTDEIK
jgi:hypothetical protein